MLRRLLARAIDRTIDRGEGLDASGDPYGAPLAHDETARLLAAIRDARFEERNPPFRAPIDVPDTTARVDVLMRPPRESARWAVMALPYGGFHKPRSLGLYEIHARALATCGFGLAVPEAPFHGARTVKGERSGWGFVRADLGHTMRASAAYAADVAALARHLREREGATRVVGFSLSLGGAALGLAAATGAPFDRLAFLAAVDNPASFYATGANREARRRTLAAAGMGIADVARAFAPLAPSSYPVPAPSMFGVPRHDLVVPASTQDAWRVAWQGERLDLRSEGHGTALASVVAARRLARWLASG